MTTQQTMEATIFASSHPNIVKHTSITAMIFSSCMVVVGFGILYSSFQIEDNSSTLAMLLMVAGSALLLAGIFRFFWKTKQLVYAPTGSGMKERTMFYGSAVLDQLEHLIESGDFSNNTFRKLKSSSSGNVRLDVLISNDANFVALQLFQFVPYTYTAVTPVVYFSGENAREVAEFLNASRSK